jgi:hypothetical protein
MLEQRTSQNKTRAIIVIEANSQEEESKTLL